MKVLSIYNYLFFVAGSFLLCLLLTPLVKRLAVATGQVAVPKDTRWHKKETPLLGGISIFLSYMIVWVLGGRFVGFPTTQIIDRNTLIVFESVHSSLKPKNTSTEVMII